MTSPVARLAAADGVSLIELVVAMTILGSVLAGLSGMLASSITAEVDLRKRFEAQQDVRLALDKIRREAHCASAVSVPSSGRVALTLPSYCRTGSGEVNWCAEGSAAPFRLRRIAGAWPGSCTGGLAWAEHLTTNALFTYSPPAVNGNELPKLRVDLPVDADTRSSAGSYRLRDDIVLRNAIRS